MNYHINNQRSILTNVEFRQLKTNINKIYFDGLMKMKQRSKEMKLNWSQDQIQRIKEIQNFILLLRKEADELKLLSTTTTTVNEVMEQSVHNDDHDIRNNNNHMNNNPNERIKEDEL